MNQPYSRISENVLFAALVAAVIGWAAFSVAADQQAASSANASVAAAAQVVHS